MCDEIDYCATCKHYDCEPHFEPCVSCKTKYDGPPTKYSAKKRTNADRIRAMSDEELAVFVRAVIMAEDCPVTGCDCDKCFFKEPCFNGSKWHGKEMEWLKQPVKEEPGND